VTTVAVDQGTDARRHQPRHEQAKENPAIVNEIDQPRSAAISGIVRTGG
jgi:hypothetical protein